MKPPRAKVTVEISECFDIVGRVQDAKEKGSGSASFENALQRLEQIVESMEEGEIPLDDLLRKYEEGNELLKVCNKRLRDAELKIELLKKNGTGETLAPLDPEAV